MLAAQASEVVGGDDGDVVLPCALEQPATAGVGSDKGDMVGVVLGLVVGKRYPVDLGVAD